MAVKDSVNAQVDFSSMINALGSAASDTFNLNNEAKASDDVDSWPIPEDDDDKIVNLDNNNPKPDDVGIKDNATDKDTEVNKTPPSNDIKPIEDASFVVDYLNFLKEGGVISSELTDEEINDILSKAPSEEEGQIEVLKYVQEKELNAHKDSLKANYDEYANEYVKLRENGFSSADATEMIANLEVLDSITDDAIESDEGLRKQLIGEFYRTTMTNPDETRIAKLVKRAVDSGEDIDEAKEAKAGLIKYAKDNNEAKVKQVNEAKENAKKSELAYIESVKKFTEEINEIIPGQKINSVTKNKLVDLVTKPVAKTAEGKAVNAFWATYMANPAKTEIILAYLNDIGTFKGKLDKLAKVAETTAANKLQKKLSSMGNTRFNVNNLGSSEVTGVGKGIIEAFEKNFKGNDE